MAQAPALYSSQMELGGTQRVLKGTALMTRPSGNPLAHPFPSHTKLSRAGVLGPKALLSPSTCPGGLKPSLPGARVHFSGFAESLQDSRVQWAKEEKTGVRVLGGGKQGGHKARPSLGGFPEPSEFL